MFANPPDTSQAGYVAVMTRVMASLSNDPPLLGGSTVCEARPGDMPERVHGDPRLIFPCEGRQRYALSVQGKRLDMVLEPGQCIYTAPNAWAIDFWDIPGDALGIVLQREYLRLVQVRCNGDGQPPTIFGAYHTALPIGAAGSMVCKTLNYLAEEGDAHDGARELLLALLCMIRRQVREDGPASRPGRAQFTWRAARGYLEENFAQPVTRESVARALNLHPGYLSALSRQVTGRSFQYTLDAIRIQHAQRLLHDTDMKLDRIARLCGYSKSTSLAKAFRRVTGGTPGQFRNSAPRR